MPELIGVGKMPAVPGHQEIALVERRQGKVHCVTRRVTGHEAVSDVSLDNFGDCSVEGQ
jgi:hypothetical protein